MEYWSAGFQVLGAEGSFLKRKTIGTRVNTGIMAIAVSTGRIVKISASFPVRGVSNPPVPKASPIIRLEAMDFPLGASFCASATPKGMVAIIKNPDKKKNIKIQLPGK